MGDEAQSGPVDSTNRTPFYSRQYIVNKPFQHRLIGTLLGVWLAYSIFFTLVLYLFYEGHVKVFYELVPREGMYPLLTVPGTFGLAVASVVFFGLIVTGIMSLYVSNQIAGPLFRMKKYLERVGQGDWSRTLRFRHNDFLRDLPGVYNAMVASLRARVESDLAELGRIENEADPARMKEIARTLREKKEDQIGLGDESAASPSEGDSIVSIAVH